MNSNHNHRERRRGWNQRRAGGRLGLLAVLILVVVTGAGCWLWEEPPSPDQTPAPTATPPTQEEAGPSSPDIQGRLLYASAGHIWLRTGTTARRLTEETTGTQPAWSPDGTQIAFVVQGEYYSDIWVMNADGSNPHPITAGRSASPQYSYESAHGSYWAAQPQYIPPDGLWISFVSHTLPTAKSSLLSVWIMHADDGGERTRWLSLSQHIENPIWSPDGDMMAFTVYFRDSGAQLRYLDADNNVHRLGTDVKDIQRYDPAWSPDGLWIAYAARQGEGGATDLWVMPSPLHPLYEEEWSPVRLTQMGAARGPAWSPNSRQIAFIAAEGGSFDLWLLDLDTSGQLPQPAGKPQRLTSGGEVDATSRPSWAP